MSSDVERNTVERAAVRLVVNGLVVRNQLTSCLSCEHYNEQAQGCKLANNQTPPPEVVVFGCAQWQGHIPF